MDEFEVESLPSMKREIIAALWEVVDQFPWIRSATLTGSFLNADVLEGISDIDYIVIVDQLNAARFRDLQHWCAEKVGHVLAQHDWRLRLNSTLGPLKFNEEKCAVLHLMVYSTAAHVEHVIQSPFTCFDWQLSPAYRGLHMAEVYPTFGLQPRHFMSARRSISDYLKDYRARVISYRELACDDDGYTEEKCEKSMTIRDQHEFAYHILRFLMRNIVKLVQRRNDDLARESMLTAFFEAFPADEPEIRDFFSELSRCKRSFDFSLPTQELDARLERFVSNFESQFRDHFLANATRHVVFRHAETPANRSEDHQIRFLGHSDPGVLPIMPDQLQPLSDAVAALNAPSLVSSPLRRCRDSLEALSPNVEIQVDVRLIEINYGDCEGLSVAEARRRFPGLFEDWRHGLDPSFPGGESTQQVADRALTALEQTWDDAQGDTVTCTHNVVLRTLIGSYFGIPPKRWHQLRIPHLAPISVIRTEAFGWFVNLDPQIEREIFRNFVEENQAP